MRIPISLAVLLHFGAVLSTAVAQSPSPAAPLPSVTLPADLDRVLRDYERAWKSADRMTRLL